MNKKLIITIDTEFDNGWDWKYGDAITTTNSAYIPRFQELCEKYGFIPTYLITYEFTKDKKFVEYMKPKQDAGKCEIGIHPHAWNIPPLYKMEARTDCEPGYVFLKEYPKEIIYEKIKTLKNEYIKQFGCEPRSHRAARWAMTKEYFEELNKNGILFDCSVTPQIDWTSAKGYTADSCGPNYVNFPKTPYKVKDTSIIEIPMTVYKDHRFTYNEDGIISKKRNIKNFIRAVKGKRNLWLRPSGDNIDDLLYVLHEAQKRNAKYIMFMLHSSEMMPGGSPSFRTSKDIDILYKNLEILFREISLKYEGISLCDYGNSIRKTIRYFG